MSTSIEKLIADFKRQPEYVSAKVIAVSEYIASQCNNTNTVAVDCVFSRDGDARQIEIVLDQGYLDGLDFGQNLGQLLINELMFCNCGNCEKDGEGSITNFTENKGKPVYYIRPEDNTGVRLQHSPVVLVTITPVLQKLVDVLLAVNGVSDVVLEEPLHEELKQSADCDNTIIVKCITSRGRKAFALPEVVYNDETAHQQVVSDFFNIK